MYQDKSNENCKACNKKIHEDATVCSDCTLFYGWRNLVCPNSIVFNKRSLYEKIVFFFKSRFSRLF